MFTLGLLDTLMKYGLSMAVDTGVSMSADVERAKTGITALFLGLLIPIVIVLIFIIRSIYRNTIGKRMKTTLLEDYEKEAEGFENSRKYVSAALIYESKLGALKKAVALYEKGNDYKSRLSL